MVSTEVVLEYEGQDYTVTVDGFDTEEQADWYWTEGNGSCDCNRIIHISTTYEGLETGDLKCGEEIKLKELKCHSQEPNSQL